MNYVLHVNYTRCFKGKEPAWFVHVISLIDIYEIISLIFLFFLLFCTSVFAIFIIVLIKPNNNYGKQSGSHR